MNRKIVGMITEVDELNGRVVVTENSGVQIVIDGLLEAEFTMSDDRSTMEIVFKNGDSLSLQNLDAKAQQN